MISTSRKHRIARCAGQTTSEYLVLIAAVAAAFVMMSSLISFTMQGRLKQIQDYVAEKDSSD